MKDTRKPGFLSDLSRVVRGPTRGVMTGLKKFCVKSYYRFNTFAGEKPTATTGKSFLDYTTEIAFDAVKGIPGTGGSFTDTVTGTKDVMVFGEKKTYVNTEVLEGVRVQTRAREAAIGLPLNGADMNGSLDRSFLVRRNAASFDPSNLEENPNGLTYMFKGTLQDNQNNQTLFMVGDPGGTNVTFSLEYTSVGQIRATHKTSTGAASTNTLTLTNAATPTGTFGTLFATAFVNTNNQAAVGALRWYDPNGNLVAEYTGTAVDSGTRIQLLDPTAAIGYGPGSGSWNAAYTKTDFLDGVDLFEFAVFCNVLSAQEMAFIAGSHAKDSSYKSGFNNRSINRAQQLRDAKATLPRSAHPTVPPTLTPAFNDENTHVFGDTPRSGSVSGLVYPEALPAYMFSGSTADRGAEGDGKNFYRDIHTTEFDRRLVAPGALRQGVAHPETMAFDLSSRNSPISISQDTNILGGTVQPFDDNHPLIDVVSNKAVSENVFPGLQQRMGDHVAIVIDLNPTTSTTIGADPSVNPPGVVTSMAYFNFSTRKWETAGKNNEFTIPGAVLISTGAAGTLPEPNAADLRDINEKHRAVISAVGSKLFASASVAFAGTSGFTIRKDAERSLDSLRSRALPTSNYGFPIDKKYEASDGQLIKMSDYIDAPFLLERVSFEFGAAIEDSGPHSLGYLRDTFDPRDGASIQKMGPFIGPERSDAAPSPNGETSVFGRSLGYNFSRGEFINGSPLLDPWSISQTQPDFHRGRLLMSSSAVPLRRLLLLQDPSYDDRSVDTELKLVMKQDDQTTPAHMLLKTQLGKRNKVPQSTSTERQFRWEVGDVGSGDYEERPIAYIPILAGGINGVVTGSRDAKLLDDAKGYGPWALVQPNALSPTSENNFEGTDWGREQQGRGGTPFWRADSFFLLKQSSKPISIKYYREIKVTAGMDHMFFPLAPYAGCKQEWRSQYFRLNGIITGGLNAFDPSLGSSNRQMYGSGYVTGALGNGGDKTIISSYQAATTRELITFGQMAHYGYTNAADSFMDTLYVTPGNEKGVHEGISSGSHNLTFLDQIMPAVAGSGYSATRRLTKVPLFGQAIKYANYIDYSYSAIPANIEKVSGDLAREGWQGRSKFSDMPDSFQGQQVYNAYATRDGHASMFTGQNPPIALKSVKQSLGEIGLNTDNNTVDAASGSYTSFTEYDGGQPRLNKAQHNLAMICKGGMETRNMWGVSARYALSGAAPGSAVLKDTRTDASSVYEGAWSLDTFPPYTRANTGSAMYGIPGNYSLNYTFDPDQRQGPYNSSFKIGAIMPQGINGVRDVVYGNIVTGPAQSPTPDSVYYTMPQGSGLSVISTPAYLADEVSAGFRDGTTHFDEYGTFFSGSLSYAIPGWLDAGLSRDLNIMLNSNSRHEGINPDFTDNWCGFTLMTASTVYRPYESPGRESAALPLVANVYKRQWLNYKKNFRIDVPVRATMPTNIEAPGAWVFTTENAYAGEVGSGQEDPFQRTLLSQIPVPKEGQWDVDGATRPGPPASIDPTTVWSRPEYGFVAPSDSPQQRSALNSKLYHTRFSVSITEGGFVPGPDFSNINSARVFTARAGGSTPLQSEVQGPFTFLSPFYKALGGDSVTNPISTLGDKDLHRIADAAILSGSIPGTPTQETMYLLQPDDKLVLGVQPSLPGWNEGSGLPNNRYSLPWGPWDKERSYDSNATRAVLRSEPVDNADDTYGAFIYDRQMNLEDPYEPAHGLTMLEGPSRLVLYGTFLRDNKHYSPSSPQALNSDSIHEALHSDNPVVDQYLVGSLEDYGSSYLTEHVVGHITSNDLAVPPSMVDAADGARRVTGRAEENTLYFSGSFQRFTRTSETSQVYYDTLMHDPFEVATALGGYAKKSLRLSGYAIINLNIPDQNRAKNTADELDGGGSLGSVEKYPYALATGWGSSFPFESKFAKVSRLTTMDTSFGGQRAAVIRLAYPAIDDGTAPSGALTPTQTTEFLSQNGGGTLGNVLSLPGASPNSPYTPGIDIANIRNMANVRTANYHETNDYSWSSAGRGLAYPPPADDRRSQRMFFATFAGYGRTNRKQLDFAEWRTFGYNTSSPPVGIRGVVYCDHPAGFKYGYMNSDHLSPSAVHRGDRYGQFRDMLEQRLYSKVYSYGDEFNRRGESDAAVTCIFVDASGAPVSDATKTQCLNLSTAMTSSKPYIEGEVLREIIFSSESVTVE